MQDAAAQATRQLELLDAAPMTPDELRMLRNRAWAVFIHRYDLLRRAGEYLTGDPVKFARLSA